MEKNEGSVQNNTLNFCGSCGTQVKQGIRFCPNCGAVVKITETSTQNFSTIPTVAKYQDDTSTNGGNNVYSAANQPIVNPQYTPPFTPKTSKPMNPKKKKKLFIVVGTALVVVAALAVVIGLLVNEAKYTKIDMKEAYTFKTSGLNGKGVVTQIPNETYLTEKFSKALGITPENSTNLSLNYLLSEDGKFSPPNTLQEKKINALSAAITSIKTNGIENNKKYSNGDNLSIKITYDKALMDAAYIKLENTGYTVNITDLSEGKKLDVFEGLKLEYSGISPNLNVKLNKNNCDPFVKNYVSFSLDKDSKVKKNDKLIITASYEQSEVDEKEYIIDQNTKEYTVSGGAEYLSSFKDVDLTLIEKEISDKLKAHISYNTEITTGKLNAKYLLKIKDQYVSSYSNNNQLVYVYEYQKTNETTPIIAIGLCVNNIIKNEDGTLKWDYNISVEEAPSIVELTNALVNTKVDIYNSIQID